MLEQGTARDDFPNGYREPDLGRTANSWRVEDAWIRDLGANRTPMDAESAEKSRAGKAMGGFLEQSQGSYRSNGFLHCADAYLRRPLWLLRYCA
jgi:hypothetical protein